MPDPFSLLRGFYFDLCLQIPGHDIHVGFTHDLGMGLWFDHELPGNRISFGVGLDCGLENHDDDSKEWHEIA